MAMRAEEIEAMILAAFPDAVVEIRDLAGDGDHYAARVVSPSFAGMSRVRQHQAVYAALKGKMGTDLHALAAGDRRFLREIINDQRHRPHRRSWSRPMTSSCS